MDIGFIGLGNMGSGMAANLLRAGHRVTAYNRSLDKVDALAERGARPASTVAEACGGEVVVSMLADDAAVEAVTFGADGILASLGAGAVHVSCSTISVALATRLNAAHAEAGQRLVVKLSGNFLIASVIESLGEAMALVGKAGVDKLQYLDILTSTLFGSPVYSTYGGLVAREQFEPAGFAATLGLKDIRLVLAAGEELQVPLPIASLLRDRFLTLLANGGGQLDWAAVGALSAWEAGGNNPVPSS